MKRKTIVVCALVLLGAALLVSGGRAQQVAEFHLGKPPAHAAGAESQHLSFTLAAHGTEVSGARIFLAPPGKPHPSRRTWRYVGMVSFFPESEDKQVMFDLPLPGVVRGERQMIAEPIVEGKGVTGTLRIVTASVGEEGP